MSGEIKLLSLALPYREAAPEEEHAENTPSFAFSGKQTASQSETHSDQHPLLGDIQLRPSMNLRLFGTPSAPAATEGERASALLADADFYRSLGAIPAARRHLQQVVDRWTALTPEKREEIRPQFLAAQFWDKLWSGDPDGASFVLSQERRFHPGTQGLEGLERVRDEVHSRYRTQTVLQLVNGALMHTYAGYASADRPKFAEALQAALQPHVDRFQEDVTSGRKTLADAYRDLAATTVSIRVGQGRGERNQDVNLHGLIREAGLSVNSQLDALVAGRGCIQEMEESVVRLAADYQRLGSSEAAGYLASSVRDGHYVRGMASDVLEGIESAAIRATATAFLLRFNPIGEGFLKNLSLIVPFQIAGRAGALMGSLVMPAIAGGTESALTLAAAEFLANGGTNAAVLPLITHEGELTLPGYLSEVGHNLALQAFLGPIGAITQNPVASRMLAIGGMMGFDLATNPAMRDVNLGLVLANTAANDALARGGHAEPVGTPRERIQMWTASQMVRETIAEGRINLRPVETLAIGALATAGCTPEGMSIDPLSFAIGAGATLLVGIGLALMRGSERNAPTENAPAAETPRTPSIAEQAQDLSTRIVAASLSAREKIAQGVPVGQVYDELVAAGRTAGFVMPMLAESHAMDVLVKAAAENPALIPQVVALVRSGRLLARHVVDTIERQIFQEARSGKVMRESNGWIRHQLGSDPIPQTAEALNHLLELACELRLPESVRLRLSTRVAEHPNATLEGCLEAVLETPSSYVVSDADIMNAVETLAHHFPKLGAWMDAHQDVLSHQAAQGDPSAALAFVRANAMDGLFFPASNAHAFLPLMFVGDISFHGIAEFVRAHFDMPTTLGIMSASFFAAGYLFARVLGHGGRSESTGQARSVAAPDARRVAAQPSSPSRQRRPLRDAFDLFLVGIPRGLRIGTSYRGQEKAFEMSAPAAELPALSNRLAAHLRERGFTVPENLGEGTHTVTSATGEPYTVTLNVTAPRVAPRPIPTARDVHSLLASLIGMDTRTRNGDPFGENQAGHIGLNVSLSHPESGPVVTLTVSGLEAQMDAVAFVTERAEQKGLTVARSRLNRGDGVVTLQICLPEGEALRVRIREGEVTQHASPETAPQGEPTSVLRVAGENWQATSDPRRNPDGDGWLHTAGPVTEDGVRGFSEEGSLRRFVESFPELAETLLFARNEDGTVSYPDATALNGALEKSGYGFRMADILGRIDPLTAARGIAEEIPAFPYAKDGSENYHDIAVHLGGYAALPPRVREHLRLTAARLVAAVENAERTQDTAALQMANETLADFIANVDGATADLGGHLANGREDGDPFGFSSSGVRSALDKLMDPFGGPRPRYDIGTLENEALDQARGNPR